MTLPIYPVLPGLAYPVKWGPVFFTQSQKTVTGGSVDISLAQRPIVTFELTYEFLRDVANDFLGAPDNELKTLLSFFATMKGSAGRFLYDHPDDDSINQGNYSQGLGDGVNNAFSLSSARTTALIGDIIGGVGTLNVYLNGVLKTPGTDYVVVVTAGQVSVQFTAPPGAGVSVSVDASYYYYCKFAEDIMIFDKFVGGDQGGGSRNQRPRSWSTVASVKLQSCRPNL